MGGLNTGQLVSGAGRVAGARAKHAGVLMDNREQELRVQGLNRLMDEDNRAAVGAAIVGLDEDPYKTVGDETLPEGKAPAPVKTPGLQMSTRTGQKLAATVGTGGLSVPGGTAVGGKGAVVEPVKTATSLYGDVKLPPSIKAREDLFYDRDKGVGPVEQGEDETDIAFAARKAAGSKYNPLSAGNVAERRAQGGLKKDYLGTVAQMDILPFSTPADKKAAGFASEEELETFRGHLNANKDKVHQWFGQRPGSIDEFNKLSVKDQTQTIKYILNQVGVTEAPTSDLPPEVKREAVSAASEITAVMQQMNIPGRSVVEEAPPSKKWTQALIENPGAPRGELQKAMQRRELIRKALVARAHVSQDAVLGEQSKELRTELAVIDANMLRMWGAQATQDFNNGDPRLMQQVMKEQYGQDTLLQPLDNGNFNIMVRDAKTGELVPKAENVSQADVSSGFKILTDKVYAAEYQKQITDTNKIKMEFDKEAALKMMQHQFNLTEVEAKARMDVIISGAKGEGVKLFNGKFNGTDGLFRQYPDGTVEQYVPETETEEGKVVGPTWRPVDYVI